MELIEILLYLREVYVIYPYFIMLFFYSIDLELNFLPSYKENFQLIKLFRQEQMNFCESCYVIK